MKQIIPELQDLKLSLPRKIDFQTGDEDFFLGKIYGPYKEITNMAKSGKFSFSKFFKILSELRLSPALRSTLRRGAKKVIQVQSTRADGDACLVTNLVFLFVRSRGVTFWR